MDSWHSRHSSFEHDSSTFGANAGPKVKTANEYQIHVNIAALHIYIYIYILILHDSTVYRLHCVRWNWVGGWFLCLVEFSAVGLADR